MNPVIIGSSLFDRTGQLAPDAPKGLGRAMAGGGDKAGRRAFDYYPTPPDCTRAFLRAEELYIRLAGDAGGFWEPCGRGGALARVAAEFGLAAVASDIVADPAHDVRGLNLFDAQHALHKVVVTNPPFAHWREMLVYLWMRLRVDYVAFLLKATALNVDKMAQIERQGLVCNGEYKLTWRPDFTDGGNPTMACSWFVWDRCNKERRGGLLDREGLIVPDDGGGLL